MSIFGSRDDDPLLQDDPFAPSSEEVSPDDKRSSDGERSGDDASDADAPSPDDQGRPDSSEAALNETVFGTPTEAESAPPKRGGSSSEGGQSRVIVYRAEEAADGRLTQLNSAIDAGWRLRRVELQAQTQRDRMSDAAASRSLAFVLRRPAS